MNFYIVIVLTAFCGLSSATLKDDFQEFVELVPIKQIKEIADRYAMSDPDVQRAIKYLRGSEWAKLVKTISANPSWQDFKGYLSETGIDVEGIIKAIHKIISEAGKAKHVAASRSMRKFIDEVLELIPTDKFLVLLDDKLANSVEFQAFWERISTEKAHKLIEDIRAIPEVKRVADVVRAWGIDIDAVLNLIYTLFGWA